MYQMGVFFEYVAGAFLALIIFVSWSNDFAPTGTWSATDRDFSFYATIGLVVAFFIGWALKKASQATPGDK